MFELLCIDYDHRVRAYCVTARVKYSDYLQLTASSEENLKIQRQIIRDSKAYQTLRADLRRRCVLPPIVLALEHVTLPVTLTPDAASVGGGPGIQQILDDLNQAIDSGLHGATVYIIDGLQRTNALRQTRDELQTTPEELQVFMDTMLRVELWMGISFGAVAYRMLLLNAGLKPMSIKHQIEVLSAKLSDELGSITGIEIFKSTDARRRTQPGQFALSRLAQAFQAWLQGQPSIDTRNAVMEQLLAESAIDTLGHSLAGNVSTAQRDSYKQLVEWIVQTDHLIPDAYREFFGSDTVLQGLAAAVGSAERKDVLKDRMRKALHELTVAAAKGDAASALGIETYNQLRIGFDVAKVNVGQATREMVFHAFQEYFFSGGEKDMKSCWEFAASRA